MKGKLKSAPEVEKKLGIKFYFTAENGIGGRIKTVPLDFHVKEITDWTASDEGGYLILRVTKENWDTLQLVKELASALRIGTKRIGFAGTKDKFAVTTQKMSVWGISEDDIKKVRLPRVEIEVLGRSKKPVALGDLRGNEFDVVIRDVSDAPDEVEAKVKAIASKISEAGGVPNFFGVQRFGTSRPITHIVGKHLVRGDLQAAVLTYLSEIFPGESDAAKNARRLCAEGKFKESLKQMPPFLRYEKAILNVLVKDSNDFLGALRSLPASLRRMFVHAYQSYLFNLTLSYRLEACAELGVPFAEALVGDIVCYRGADGSPDVNKTEKVTESKLEGVNRLVKRQRAFVTAPLFGYETELADGLQGEIERRVLDKEGVALEDFKIKAVPELASRGWRREILMPVRDLKFEVSKDELHEDKTKVRLHFSLPKGGYATVVLREFMKERGVIF
ncbi:MAG: tRNA U13 pseudouridine synthase TruD [Candidatus Alkanophagales archaeon MCA70_species_1]|nr:tRNA U13 pseudouridine synthase TruD [Candidatus Alkanophaga volatiphilum]